jgi:hypothetical protein
MINAGLTSGYVDICADLGSGLIVRDGTGGHATYLTTPATGTLRVTSDGSTLGTVEAATGTFTSTSSLLLGTAGSAVGNIGFRNATSGTTTLAPATGALGTGTVTLPLSGTLATLQGSNTYTGTTNTFTLPTTTGTTTTSGIAVAANSLTTGTGIYASSTSLTTGKLMELAVSPTGTQAPISLNLSATWNTSGSPALLKGRITNTASGSYTSYLLDFGTVATRYFGLTAEGRLYLGSGGIYVHEGGAFQNNSGYVQFSSSLSSTANNSYDLGASGLRWKTLYIGTSIVNSGTLAVTGATTLTGLLTANGGITLGDAQDIAFNTTTGTKIGAATTQKLSFWNATPVVQPTTAVASATVAHTGGGTNIKTDDTFDGYTIAQVVKALRNAGLLA